MVRKICTRCGKKWEEYNILSYDVLCPDCRKKKKYWFRNMNKKGASFSSYTELFLGIFLFVFVLGLIITDMNTKYNRTDINSSFGYVTNITTFTDMQNKLQNSTTTGVSITSVFGFSIDTIWGMVKTLALVIWNIISGNWITQSVGFMQLGPVGTILALVLQLIVALSVGFIIIKIVTKIKP